MSLSQKQGQFAVCIAKLILKAEGLGCTLTFGDAYRDPRDHGEFGEKASYGSKNSVHKIRLAVDFNYIAAGQLIHDSNHPNWIVLGEFWESLHPDARWGGRFNDANHFSFTHWGAK